MFINQNTKLSYYGNYRFDYYWYPGRLPGRENIEREWFGLIVNLIVGIIGGVLGGWLFGLLGLSVNGVIGSLVMSTIGAIVLLWIVSLFKRE